MDPLPPTANTSVGDCANTAYIGAGRGEGAIDDQVVPSLEWRRSPALPVEVVPKKLPETPWRPPVFLGPVKRSVKALSLGPLCEMPSAPPAHTSPSRANSSLSCVCTLRVSNWLSSLVW